MRAEIDGVAVTWQDLPDYVRAVLVFGAGARDEAVDQIGLNHLVQLLVLEAVSTEADQSTTLLDTAFTASGTPDEVAEHLIECCAALSHLPLDRLAEVAAQADAGDRAVSVDLDMDDPCRDPWGSLLARRLGAAGAGAFRWPPIDYTAFTADEVRAHMARFFTAGNAALAVTRQPWPGLRLPLPPGERADHPDTTAARSGGWYDDEVIAPGIAITAEAGPAALLVLPLLHRRVGDALDEAGIDSWNTPWYTPVTASTVQLGLALSRLGERGRDCARAAQLMWEQLRLLAAQPPTQAEVDQALAWYTRDTQSMPADVVRRMEQAGLAEQVREAFGIGRLRCEARNLVLDPSDDPGPEEISAAAALTPGDLRAAVASWLGTALLVVPAGTVASLDGLARIGCPTGSYTPQGDVLRPSLWRKLRGGGAEHLVLGVDGIHHVRADGSVHSFPAGDAIVVEQGKRVLLGNIRHGCLVDVTVLGDARTLAARLPQRRHRTVS